MEEVDDLFFPGPGGKSKQAKIFCSDCPFRTSCLQEAIKNDLEGFWAGTTKIERTGMMQFVQGLTPVEINVEDYLPKRFKTGKPRIRRKVAKHDDPYSWLDQAEPTEEELLALA